jgi:hypothetical protein
MKIRTFACAELLVAGMGWNKACAQNVAGDTSQVLNMVIDPSAASNCDKMEELLTAAEIDGADGIYRSEKW